MKALRRWWRWMWDLDSLGYVTHLSETEIAKLERWTVAQGYGHCAPAQLDTAAKRRRRQLGMEHTR